jgi:hypothetical protein
MGMTPEKWAEVEAAAEARAGGRMVRGLAADRSPFHAALEHERAKIKAGGHDQPAVLPEAAFDWPVYRAALGLDNA